MKLIDLLLYITMGTILIFFMCEGCEISFIISIAILSMLLCIKGLRSERKPLKTVETIKFSKPILEPDEEWYIKYTGAVLNDKDIGDGFKVGDRIKAVTSVTPVFTTDVEGVIYWSTKANIPILIYSYIDSSKHIWKYDAFTEEARKKYFFNIKKSQ